MAKCTNWARQDSNLRLPPCEDGTLTTELRARGRSKRYISFFAARQVRRCLFGGFCAASGSHEPVPARQNGSFVGLDLSGNRHSRRNRPKRQRQLGRSHLLEVVENPVSGDPSQYSYPCRDRARSAGRIPMEAEFRRSGRFAYRLSVGGEYSGSSSLRLSSGRQVD